MDCGGKTLDSLENEALSAFRNAYSGETSALRARNPSASIVAGVFLPRNRTLHVSSRQ
jgi:hypothetical protein